jgi:hypothetical protein
MNATFGGIVPSSFAQLFWAPVVVLTLALALWLVALVLLDRQRARAATVGNPDSAIPAAWRAYLATALPAAVAALAIAIPLLVD